MQIVEPGIATVGNGEGRLDRKRVCFLYDVNLHKLQPGTLTLLFLSLRLTRFSSAEGKLSPESNNNNKFNAPMR